MKTQSVHTGSKSSIVLLILLALFIGTSVAANSSSAAQTQEELVGQIALRKFDAMLGVTAETFRLGNPTLNYSPFEVTHVEIRDNWARIHVMSLPEDISLASPIFYGAVATRVGAEWVILFENTPEFESVRGRLPQWLRFLDVTEGLITGDTHVPALPWPVGDTWRLNDGLHTPPLGIDFGTLPQGVSSPIHAVDEGEVIYTNDTCMIIHRPDGLDMFYQHVDPTAVAQWGNNPPYVRMGDFIGNTFHHKEIRCGGDSSGHHVHFAFLHNGLSDPFTHDDYIGSSLNEWTIISESQLSKNGFIIDENPGSGANLNNRVLHSGCPQRADLPPGTDAILVLYKGKNCTGQSWFTNDLNQMIIVPAGYALSMNIRAGYKVTLYYPQSPPPYSGVYYGDLWDMSKDYYPGTSISLAGKIGSVRIEANQCVTLNENGEEVDNGLCGDVPPPPDELPPPSGPQQNGTVKITGYANFDGPILYSGVAGFSNEPNDEGYSLWIPNDWSVIVYDDDNGNGEQRCWNSSVPNLQDHGWQNRIQSIQIYRSFNACPTDPPSSPGPEVKLYRHPDYWDQVFSGGPGFYDDLAPIANSMQIPDGWSVVVYAWDGRQVQAQCFDRNVPNLANTSNWQDKIRGIDVFSSNLCQDEIWSGADYGMFVDEGVLGTNCGWISAPYATPNLDNFCGANWNDKISSFRIRAGYSIRVWEHADYQGGQACFSSLRTTVKNDAFDNGVGIYQFTGGEIDSRISSFAVFPNPYCDGSPTMPEHGWAYSTASGGRSSSLEENSNQSIQIEWVDSASDEWGYRIYEYHQNGDYSLVGEVGVNTTSFTHTSLTCGIDYHYAVKSYNQWGESATPHLVVASTASCFSQPPTAPGNLFVTHIGKTTASVAWSDNSNNETRFDVWYYDYDLGQFFFAGWAPSNSSSYTITDLACNRQYGFVVDAVNEYGYSESNYATGTTKPCNSEQPENPSNLHVSSASPMSLSLAWEDNATNETDYEVWHIREGIDPDWTIAHDLPPNTIAYTITGLNCDTEYKLVVRAVLFKDDGGVLWGESNWVWQSTQPCGVYYLFLPAAIR